MYRGYVAGCEPYVRRIIFAIASSNHGPFYRWPVMNLAELCLIALLLKKLTFNRFHLNPYLQVVVICFHVKFRKGQVQVMANWPFNVVMAVEVFAICFWVIWRINGALGSVQSNNTSYNIETSGRKKNSDLSNKS